MKWSWRIGRLAGIDVFIHWTFLLLLLWIAAAHLLSGGSIVTALFGILLVLTFFGCIVLHELGHALTARRYGVGTRDITLLPIGGVARLERIPEEPWQEFWIAVAGPAVNVAIAAVLSVFLWFQSGFANIPPDTLVGGSFLSTLVMFNLLVVAFNLLPAFPMDGGRVLRALLATRLNYVKATMIAAGVGQAMAFVFGFVGLFLNPFLLFIALFVYLGAEAEAQMAQFKSSTDRVPVREAMMTYFRSLAPDDSLQEAGRELLAGAQQDFPVVDNGQVCGILCRKDLFRGLTEEGTNLKVQDVMNVDFPTAASTETLDQVMSRMRNSECSSIPVLHDGKLVGLLTLENIGEMIMIRAALADEPIAGSTPQNLVGAP